MTPAARIAAAIEILDRFLAGEAAERALTTWARGNRYAGSKDRAAIRDLVFDALRQRRSLAALGGADTGRGLMTGALRRDGRDPGEVFGAGGYAPPALTEAERSAGVAPDEAAAIADLPDWLEPDLRRDLGPDFAGVAEALRHRAGVFLRVNPRRADRDGVIAALAAGGIAARAHPGVATAVEVTEGARALARSPVIADGLAELQDAHSQALVGALMPVAAGARVLDYCAGGGGKALALAALTGGRVAAHDADPARMTDLPARAGRAGAGIDILGAAAARAGAPWDLVIADVPCSGSGAWRRQPEARWRLTRAGLERLSATQAGILDTVAGLAAGPAGGRIAYMTCSVLEAENAGQVAAFLDRTPGWRLAAERRYLPGAEGDGLYLADLRREGG